MSIYTGEILIGKKSNLVFSTTPTSIPDNTYDSAVFTGGANAILNLPPLANIIHGYKLTIGNSATGSFSVTVTAQGSDHIGSSGTTSTLALTQGQTAALLADRINGRWQIALGPISLPTP